MKSQIEAIKTEYEQISKQLADPEVVSDSKKLAALGKRQAELEEKVQKISQYEKIVAQMQDNAEIINSASEEELKQLAMEENTKLSEEKEALEEELEMLLIPQEPHDSKDVIVEIRAGAGGDEAALFAANLFRMYSRLAEEQGWKARLLNSHCIGIGGFKEIIFEMEGNNVYKNMKYESGVHRVQRIPETEKSGRIHTSTVTVAVLPEAEEVEIKIDPGELRIDTFASSGPGGQSVNTTNSAVRVTHLPTGTIVSCQDEKSQLQNKIKAMAVLRARLLAAKEEEERKKRGDQRRSQIGTGERSEKIRTYNFPQDRVTDHRIKKSWSNLESILDGNLAEIIYSLQEEDKKLKTK